MDIPKVEPWIGDSDFLAKNPQICKIDNIETNKNKWGKDEFVLLLDMDGAKRKISIFGDNRNKLIDKFGSNSDLWIGKFVQISQVERVPDGKKIKEIKGM